MVNNTLYNKHILVIDTRLSHICQEITPSKKYLNKKLTEYLTNRKNNVRNKIALYYYLFTNFITIMETNVKNVLKWVAIFVGAIILLCLVWGAFVVVPATHVGVPEKLGKIIEDPMRGFSLKMPIITDVHEMDITLQRVERLDSTYTKDVQSAYISYVLTYRIIPENAPALYQYAKNNCEAVLIKPSINTALKDVIGQYTAMDAIDKRPVLSKQIEERIKKELSAKKLRKEYFTDISFYLSNIDYSDVFEQGIDAKVLAEQEALKVKNRTVQIEEEARQQVIKAEAEAKSIALTGEALRLNPQYIELQRLDVQKEMAKSAAKWQNPVLSSGQSSLLLGLPNK